MRSGIVRNASSQGVMKRATTAQTAQIFSHFHRVVHLVGAAKLPFTRPAANAISTPKLTSLTLPPGRLDYRTTNLSACGLGVVGVAQLASPDRTPSDAPPESGGQ